MSTSWLNKPNYQITAMALVKLSQEGDSLVLGTEDGKLQIIDLVCHCAKAHPHSAVLQRHH